MKLFLPIPQRTFQAPSRSFQPVEVAMRATRPAGVSSQATNPGVCSLISPPPAEVGGPQQGGLSLPSPGSPEQPVLPAAVAGSPAFRATFVILKGASPPVIVFFMIHPGYWGIC